MNFPEFTNVPPAAVTPEIWAAWEGKSGAAITQRIRRKQIPEECLLRPTERVVLIDVARYLEFLRAKQRMERAAKKEPAPHPAVSTEASHP